MTMPISEQLPPDEPQPQEQLPPARRRRQHRMVAGETNERSEYLADISHQSTPSFDFFLFALLSGLVLMAAILLDSQALYLLAALIAPFMAPLVGMSLAVVTGSVGFFLRSLASLVIGGALVFALGVLAGLLGQASGEVFRAQAAMHTQVTWPDAAVLVLGMIVTVYLVGRNPNAKPLVSSVALAYELFLPLGVAGYGQLTSGSQLNLWPDGLVMFAVFTALAVLVGAVIFIFQGIHPSRAVGTLVGIVLFVALLAGMLSLAAEAWWGSDLFAVLGPPSVTATLAPIATATLTSSPLPSLTATDTPQPPTPTRTPTTTIIPTGTETVTFSPSPTPVWGLVNAGEPANGVIIRAEPNSLTVITTLLNGNLIQILPELANKAGVFWIHVRTTTGLEGWVQAALIATATPRPK